ncbi:GNAT family N-acetyltransferase [Mammaliicoccus vitulinus]|uniref:GNAT family N-acetyltransferase n=1 Tax=Mammaliicoccus vitulinus TaxID=71237 RepID=UPI003B9F51B0
MIHDNYRKNIATLLLNTAIKISTEHDISGLYTIAQDNNLSANRFYLRYGFSIGGLNTKNYHFINQKGKYDIYYYLELTDYRLEPYPQDKHGLYKISNIKITQSENESNRLGDLF